MTRTAADASRGVMDRFRSMPMARLAVPFGLTGLLMLAIMVGTGLLVGWQPHRGLIPTAQAFLLMILLRYALSSASGIIGTAVIGENDHGV
jgi:ABC-2 type transport system permease protein